MSDFPCDQCGLCCQRLNLNALYKDLDRGDGTCQHFDEATLLCTVYAERPDICNIQIMHKTYFAQHYSQADFYTLNQKACEDLKHYEENRYEH